MITIMKVLLFAYLASFNRYDCRAKQSEAKSNLKAIYVSEESYRAENDTYHQSLAEVGFLARGSGNKINYQYRIVYSDAEHFIAEAIGIGSMQGDVWRIDENNNLQSVESKCGPIQEK